MKSIFEPTPAPVLKPYPYLGRYRFGSDNFVVLFTSAHSGVVVDDPTNVHGIGHADDLWNEEYFDRITGTVTLTFET